MCIHICVGAMRVEGAWETRGMRGLAFSSWGM